MQRIIAFGIALSCVGCSSLWLSQADAVSIAEKDARRRHLRLPQQHVVAVEESEFIPEMAAPYPVYQVQFSEPAATSSRKLYRYTINKNSGEVEGIIDSRRDISILR
jgi:hypothetical protein